MELKENEEDQILDPQPVQFTGSEIVEDKEVGQHRILSINATNYDKIVDLCKGRKILKAKRLPYNTHSVFCNWLRTSNTKKPLPCNCYYFGSKDDTLPVINKWKVTVMA